MGNIKTLVFYRVVPIGIEQDSDRQTIEVVFN